MSSINNWFNAIKNNDLHAYNRVSSRDLAICYNFLQIPDTSTIVLTVSIMKNKVKKNSLDPQNFAKVMSCIEDSLLETYWGNPQEYDKNPDYFSNVKSSLGNEWYIQLCCHRVFFIPENALFDTIQHLFKQENIRIMKSGNLITEVSVFANTDSYDFNAKFY